MGPTTKIQAAIGRRSTEPSAWSVITRISAMNMPIMTRAATPAQMQPMTQIACIVQLVDEFHAWRRLATGPSGLMPHSPHSGHDAESSRPRRS